MEDLDFSAKPTPRPEAAAHAAAQVAAQSPLYQPAVALEFSAQPARSKRSRQASPYSPKREGGRPVFQGARMYLLLEGEIGLMIRNKFFGVVKPGDVFGELAVIAGLPRSATAMAKINCRSVWLTASSQAWPVAPVCLFLRLLSPRDISLWCSHSLMLSCGSPESRWTPSGLRVSYQDGRGILRDILVVCTRQDFAVSGVRVERQPSSADPEDAGERQSPIRLPSNRHRGES